jgi:hypothetical protein
MAGYGQSLALSGGVSYQRGAPLRPAYGIVVPHCGEKWVGLQGKKQIVPGGAKPSHSSVCLTLRHIETTRTTIVLKVDDDFGNLERYLLAVDRNP